MYHIVLFGICKLPISQPAGKCSLQKGKCLCHHLLEIDKNLCLCTHLHQVGQMVIAHPSVLCTTWCHQPWCSYNELAHAASTLALHTQVQGCRALELACQSQISTRPFCSSEAYMHVHRTPAPDCHVTHMPSFLTRLQATCIMLQVSIYTSTCKGPSITWCQPKVTATLNLPQRLLWV